MVLGTTVNVINILPSVLMLPGKNPVVSKWSDDANMHSWELWERLAHKLQEYEVKMSNLNFQSCL